MTMPQRHRQSRTVAQPSSCRLFEIVPCGDPYSRAADLREYENSFDEPTCVFRGDLSGKWGPQTLARELRRMYPGCKIRYRKG